MPEIQPIQTTPCNINDECQYDLCPKSHTPICCYQCGTPDHVQQIQQNYDELAQNPDFTHPAIKEECEAVVQQVQLRHKCRHIREVSCKGTRIFRLI